MRIKSNFEIWELMKFIYLILISGLYSNLLSQISLNQSYPFLYNEYEMVNRNHHLNLGYHYYSFSLESSLSKKLKVINSISEYEGFNYFDFRHEFYDKKTKTGILAWGSVRIEIKRIDYLLKYEIIRFLKVFSIHGMGGIAYQQSTPLIPNSTSFLDPELFKSSPYQQTKVMKTQKFNNSQWVPMIGTEVAVKIWKFELFANWIGVKGFKAHQTWSFDYNYNGVPQPTAVAEMRGTGIFEAYGIRANFLVTKYEEKK
jgi:hypothetical protein